MSNVITLPKKRHKYELVYMIDGKKYAKDFWAESDDEARKILMAIQHNGYMRRLEKHE